MLISPGDRRSRCRSLFYSGGSEKMEILASKDAEVIFDTCPPPSPHPPPPGARAWAPRGCCLLPNTIQLHIEMYVYFHT